MHARQVDGQCSQVLVVVFPYICAGQVEVHDFVELDPKVLEEHFVAITHVIVASFA